MKLKNNALQILYDALTNCTISISPYEDAPFDKAFIECDDALTSPSNTAYWSHWYNKTQRAEEKLERANKEIEKLRREVSTKDKRNNELQSCLDKAATDLETLQKSNATLLSQNLELAKQKADITSRLHTTADARDHLRAELEKKVKRLDEITKDRDSYHGLYTELRKDYDKLFEENKKLKTRTDCHRNEVTWYRKHYKELKSRLNSMCGDEYINKLQDSVREIGYEQGQTDLWFKLQTVMDAKPWDISSFYPDVSCMDDILSWDMEDFLDAYKKWEEENKRTCEQNETERMRKWLTDFCFGRECEGCPLESSEYKCGRGYSFRRVDRFDTRIIPDEDIKRYYEKVRGCLHYTLPNDISEKIKDAENKMNKWLMNMDSWECTLEGTIEINKDLLEKVCGVKPDEGSHKLEYGDAVRLSWRDYDYMYIGPDEKEGTLVRLFDPKNHAIVTTHIANVRYNGGKIILTSEEDLRMIWKDTK